MRRRVLPRSAAGRPRRPLALCPRAVVPHAGLERGRLCTRRRAALRAQDHVAAPPAALLWATGAPLSRTAETCAAAARAGNIETVLWAHDHGAPWDAATTAALAQRGDLASLEWARTEGCPWDWRVCYEAASGGHAQLLAWARQQGCPWSGRVLVAAAFSEKYSAVLPWCVLNGCRWDEEAREELMLCHDLGREQRGSVGATSALGGNTKSCFERGCRSCCLGSTGAVIMNACMADTGI